MKVLVNNYNKPEEKIVETPSYPREHICEYCGSKLEYDKSDLRIGAYGCAYLDCPLCKEENMLEDNEMSITLTMNNLRFPDHFVHTCKENGAVDCFDDNHIMEAVRKAIDYFRNNKEEYHWFTQSGNLRIDVRRWEGDENYEVVASNNFYSAEIPFEEADY